MFVQLMTNQEYLFQEIKMNSNNYKLVLIKVNDHIIFVRLPNKNEELKSQLEKMIAEEAKEYSYKCL